MKFVGFFYSWTGHYLMNEDFAYEGSVKHSIHTDFLRTVILHWAFSVLLFTTAESVFLSVSLLHFHRGRPPSASPPPSLYWGVVSGCQHKDVGRTADVLSAWITAYCTAHFDGRWALIRTRNIGLWNNCQCPHEAGVLQKNCVYTTKGVHTIQQAHSRLIVGYMWL